jgi:hypothetical protein
LWLILMYTWGTLAQKCLQALKSTNAIAGPWIKQSRKGALQLVFDGCRELTMMSKSWNKQESSWCFGSFEWKWCSSKNARRKKWGILWSAAMILGLEWAENDLKYVCLGSLNYVLNSVSSNGPICKLLSWAWVEREVWIWHDWALKPGCYWLWQLLFYVGSWIATLPCLFQTILPYLHFCTLVQNGGVMMAWTWN